MRTTLAAAAALLLLALSPGPAGAAVADGWEERPRSLQLGFDLPAGNGYTMSVRTEGHRQVAITLSKGTVSANYQTTGRVSRNGIEADFGELGEISVQLAGREAKPRQGPSLRDLLGIPQPRCVGRRAQREAGKFQGTIRFDGERGFANVERTSAAGEMLRTYRRICQKRRGLGLVAIALSRLGKSGQLRQLAREKHSPLDAVRLNTLTAGGTEGGRAVFFTAFQVTTGPDLQWLADIFGSIAVGGTAERREGVQISRAFFTSAGSNALVLSNLEKRPITASVIFPRPLIEGRAELVQAAGEPTSWTGTMVMRLPGSGAVPITGPGIDAVLCRARPGDPLKTPCAKRSEELLPEGRFSEGGLLLGSIASSGP